MKKQNTETNVNNALLNLIAPIGLNFNNNFMSVGENLGKIYGIIRYPMDPQYGWMSKITNIPGTIAGFSFTPVDSGEFIESLNKNVSRQRALQKDAQDSLTKQRAETAANNGEKLLKQVDQFDETVGMLSTLIMPISSEKKQFNKVIRKATSSCLSAKTKLRILSNLQKPAFKQLSPFYTTDNDIRQITDRVAPLSAVLGGFPNASSGLSDDKGIYIAKDNDGGLMFLDLWKRYNDRTNSDIVVMGVKGQGKSTIVKHIALWEYALGVKLIFVDPEREYKDLCKNLGGDWINAGGGKGGRINPLQIRPIPRDDENEEEVKAYVDEGHGVGDLALYLQHLAIFFSLYIPSLDDVKKALLKNCLIELYNNFGINWDTDTSLLKPEDFPIMSDLYELILKKQEEREETRRDADENWYEKLAILLKDAAYGADAALWNGHTTLKANSKCICLDTADLQDAGNNLKRAQYFNINTWIWQQMSADRQERVRAFFDEAYLNIDPEVPQSLVFMRNAMKRDRKYEAAMVIISHAVADFLAKEVKTYGQTLVDDPCYKIMFGTDGENLLETKKLYNLTDAEESLLSSKQRKHALFMIGNKRVHAKFDIPDYEFSYFGTAGGR